MIHTHTDKEVDIRMEYYKSDSDDKKDTTINIQAKGDLEHHIIEGIVDALKTIQPHNAHLKEL